MSSQPAPDPAPDRRSVVGPPATPEAWSEDRALVARVVAGDERAWHDFLSAYSGLLIHVVRRYFADEDEARNTYVDVLERLHRGGLATYEGRSRLATWLVLVARNVALDAVRSADGRLKPPLGVDDLGAEDREVFRLYFVEGLSFEATLHALAARSIAWSAHDLAESVTRVETAISRRSMKTIRYRRATRSTGISSRLLEYLDQLRVEEAARSARTSPDAEIMRREARAMALRVLRHVGTFDAEEQRVIDLRYRRAWSANRIAEHEGYANPRQVFTLLERIRRRVRRYMKRAGVELGD